MSIVLVGTLDTKGEELGFVADVLRSQGMDVHLVDVGVMDPPEIDPDTPAPTVAESGGTSLSALRAAGDRGAAIEAMGEGAAAVATDLHEKGILEGILGIGGSGNTSVTTTAMRALPIGVPKLMVSTVASGNTEPYVGTTDIAMMYSVSDVEGINQLSATVLGNAALAMAGMVTNDLDIDLPEKPTVGITMFGVTTPCVKRAREWLEAEGYETIVFHANGSGGRAMEQLVREGIVDGVLDLTTTEWADELVGGLLGAGPDRLDAAGECEVPQVISTGALDMVNFGPVDTVPEKFDDRTIHVHNPEVTLMRTTPDENAELGRILARKANDADGPTTVALPRGGVSMLDAPDEPFHSPEADSALFEALRANLDGSVELIELDCGINDEQFALTVAKRLDTYMDR